MLFIFYTVACLRGQIIRGPFTSNAGMSVVNKTNARQTTLEKSLLGILLSGRDYISTRVDLCFPYVGSATLLYTES